MSKETSNFFHFFGDTLFGNQPAWIFSGATMISLGQAMCSNSPPPRSSLPSGYLYLGQFIAHDMTHLKSGEDKPHIEYREPHQVAISTLELDSVYGGRNIDPKSGTRGRMELGPAYGDDGTEFPGCDLPRDPLTRKPGIGDLRNDENLLIAQLHVQFLKLHNFFYDRIQAEHPELDAGQLYCAARRQVILHYQEVVLYDFLPQMIDNDVWQHVMSADYVSPWEHYWNEARMPFEFAGAAMRFGHSRILLRYNVNCNNSFNIPELFGFTHRGTIFTQSAGLSRHCVVDWQFFFPYPGETGNYWAGVRNKAFAISDNVGTSLLNLSRDQQSHDLVLAVRNLYRGNAFLLRSGQEIARALLTDATLKRLSSKIGLTEDYVARTQHALDPLNNRVIRRALDTMNQDWSTPGSAYNQKLLRGLEFNNPGWKLRGNASSGNDMNAEALEQALKEELSLLDSDRRNLPTRTPLWYYLLIEASSQTEGLKLGKIGSLIMAETIRALVKLGHVSIEGQEGRRQLRSYIEPTLAIEIDGKRQTVHQMSDLLAAVAEAPYHYGQRLCKHPSHIQ